MTAEKLQILVNIYNNLFEVSTKGEDSFIMVDNLRSLKKFIMQESELLIQPKEEKDGLEQ